MNKKQELIIVNEGLGNIFRRIGEFFSGGYPKDDNLKRIINKYNHTDISRCERLFPPKDISINMSMPENEYVKDNSISYEDYEENPKYIICVLESQYEFAASWLKYVNTKSPQEICKKNVNANRCIGWILKNKPYIEDMLEDARKSLDLLKRHGNEPTKSHSFSLWKPTFDKVVEAYLYKIKNGKKII